MSSVLLRNLDILKKKPYTHYLVSHIAILLPHCSPLEEFHVRTGISQSQLMFQSLSCCSWHICSLSQFGQQCQYIWLRILFTLMHLYSIKFQSKCKFYKESYFPNMIISYFFFHCRSFLMTHWVKWIKAISLWCQNLYFGDFQSHKVSRLYSLWCSWHFISLLFLEILLSWS